MKHKVKAGITGISIQLIIAHVRYVLSRLTGNSNFPNPPYSLLEMEADVDALDAMNQQVIAGNRTITPSRDAMLSTVRIKVNATAAYVNATAMESVFALESSGFAMVKTRSPRPVPEQVIKVECINLNPTGSAKVSWKASKERDFYVLEKRVGDGPHSVWEEVEHTTKTHCIVTGLEFRQDVYFRVSAVNSAGKSLWSDVAMLVVQ